MTKLLESIFRSVNIALVNEPEKAYGHLGSDRQRGHETFRLHAVLSDIDDLREFPSLKLMQLLIEHGAKLDYDDSFFPTLHKMRHYDCSAMRSVDISPKSLASYDCVLVATDHSPYHDDKIVENSKRVVDSRNATRHVKNNRQKVVHC